MKEIKAFPFKIDQVEDTGQFCGYAAVFGNVDLGGDVLDPGAFRKTLKAHRGRVPIFDHHDPRKHIGWNLEAREDRHGLFVCGQLNLDVQLARERHALMKQAARVGGRTGLSIGFRTVRDEGERGRPAVRRLKEIQLYEYSLVSFPMNPRAAVTQVKARRAWLGDFLRTEIGLDAARAGKALDLVQPLLDPPAGPGSGPASEPGAGSHHPGGRTDVLALLDSLIADLKT